MQACPSVSYTASGLALPRPVKHSRRRVYRTRHGGLQHRRPNLGSAHSQTLLARPCLAPGRTGARRQNCGRRHLHGPPRPASAHASAPLGRDDPVTTNCAGGARTAQLLSAIARGSPLEQAARLAVTCSGALRGDGRTSRTTIPNMPHCDGANGAAPGTEAWDVRRFSECCRRDGEANHVQHKGCCRTLCY